MKLFRVHLTETTCGDIILAAENRDEAEQHAIGSDSVDWDLPEVEVTDICEVDEDGNEVEAE